MAKSNPRRANGTRRRKNAKRLKAERRQCWICLEFGRSAVIDYSLPFLHPMAFVIDELVPVSRYREGGYDSAEQCAEDYSNLAAAHRCCNAWRSNKSVAEVRAIARAERDGGRVADKLPLPIPWEL